MSYRWISLVLSSLLLIAGIRPTAAADAASINLSAKPLFEGNYRAGNWLPFLITVTNDGPDLTALVSVQAGTSFATQLELPRGAEKSVILYARPLDEIRRTATVRVLVSGAELAKVETTIKGLSSATHVVGYITSQSLTLPLPTVKSERQRIERIAVQVADLPERGEGLSMFDTLVIDGAPLANLNAKQQQALADWVRLGGQLVLGGTELTATLAQIPEILRPATTGAAAPPGQISLLPELTADQTPAAVALVGKPNTRTIATIGTTPVGIQHELGKGRVTALGFGFSASELAQLKELSVFWENVAPFRVNTTTLEQMQRVEDVEAQQFASVLTLLPVLAVPPLTTLAILLGLYVVIVGPGLYLLLRRFDRQAWGWIAVPVVTIVFSLGAYGYGMRLRGNDTILNQITVIEPLAGRAEVRTYAGIFSPRTQTYEVGLNDEALVEPIVGDGVGAGAGAISTGQYLQSSAGIRNLGVPQWSLRSFMARQIMDVQPLEAKLTVEGTTLRGTVQNLGTTPITNVALLHDVQIAKIGTLQPGETRAVELALDGAPSFDRNVGLAGMLLDVSLEQLKLGGQLSTETRMQQTMIDTLFNPLYDPPKGPVVVGWLDSTPLTIDLGQSRAQHQQLTIVLAPADISFSETGSVSLANGWFNPTFEVSGTGVGGPCLTRSGDGWYMDMGTLTTTMQLPAALQPIQLDTATMIVERDGPPSAFKLSVYDWQERQWVEQALTNDSITLSEPGRYFSSSGLLQARVEMESSNAKGGGCVSLNLQVEGHRA